MSYGFEPGFVKLNQFFKGLGLGFYGLQFFISSFCALIVFRNIQRTSERPSFILLLYVFMFYFFTDMAQTRQHIAMAILILGNRFILERNFFLASNRGYGNDVSCYSHYRVPAVFYRQNSDRQEICVGSVCCIYNFVSVWLVICQKGA